MEFPSLARPACLPPRPLTLVSLEPQPPHPVSTTLNFTLCVSLCGHGALAGGFLIPMNPTTRKVPGSRTTRACGKGLLLAGKYIGSHYFTKGKAAKELDQYLLKNRNTKGSRCDADSTALLKEKPRESHTGMCGELLIL